MKQTKYTIICVFAIIFLKMAILTELPKVPLAVLVIGILTLSLIMTRRKNESQECNEGGAN